MEFTPVGRICSFCGLVGEKDTKFAGGFGAMMCIDCVEQYHEIFTSEKKLASVRRPPWENLGDAELLEKLPLIARTADQVDDFMHHWVGLLRERKLSWAHIGRVLGVSRQAAWERFSGSSRESDTA